MNASHEFPNAEKNRKQNAILEASASSIALCGMGVQTEAIAKKAGVSKGTLFLYFSSKEELFCQLHRYLKNDLLFAVATEYPANESVERQLRHIWECYLEWAYRANAKYKALRQLEMSSRFHKISYENSLFSAIDYVTSTVNQYDIPRDQRATFLFLCNIMESIAATVLEMAEINPSGFGDFKSLGWITFWGAAVACITLSESG